jgi:serine/threonine protein phosphatase PrpC
MQDAASQGIAHPVENPDPKGYDPIFTRYGTTLIAALVIKDSIVAGQIGDGDLLMVRPDGTIEFPLPRDLTMTGNETRSLSSSDAHLLWRTATFDRGHGGVLVAATDGVSDSFEGSDSEEFRVFIKSLADRISTYGMEPVARAMSGWLDRYSAVASGDDMTLVYVYVQPDIPEHDDTPHTGPVSDNKTPALLGTGDDALLAWEGW